MYLSIPNTANKHTFSMRAMYLILVVYLDGAYLLYCMYHSCIIMKLLYHNKIYNFFT